MTLPTDFRGFVRSPKCFENSVTVNNSLNSWINRNTRYTGFGPIIGDTGHLAGAGFWLSEPNFNAIMAQGGMGFVDIYEDGAHTTRVSNLLSIGLGNFAWNNVHLDIPLVVGTELRSNYSGWSNGAILGYWRTLKVAHIDWSNLTMELDYTVRRHTATTGTAATLNQPYSESTIRYYGKITGGIYLGWGRYGAYNARATGVNGGFTLTEPEYTNRGLVFDDSIRNIARQFDIEELGANVSNEMIQECERVVSYFPETIATGLGRVIVGEGTGAASAFTRPVPIGDDFYLSDSYSTYGNTYASLYVPGLANMSVFTSADTRLIPETMSPFYTDSQSPNLFSEALADGRHSVLAPQDPGFFASFWPSVSNNQYAIPAEDEEEYAAKIVQLEASSTMPYMPPFGVMLYGAGTSILSDGSSWYKNQITEYTQDIVQHLGAHELRQLLCYMATKPNVTFE